MSSGSGAIPIPALAKELPCKSGVAGAKYYYYVRPRTRWLVSRLRAIPGVQLVFCTSMMGSNAEPAVRYILGTEWGGWAGGKGGKGGGKGAGKGGKSRGRGRGRGKGRGRGDGGDGLKVLHLHLLEL